MASRAFWLSLFSAVAPLCLSSCELAVDIIVVQLDDGRISIETSDGSKHPPCIKDIRITRVVPNISAFDYPEIWSVYENMNGVEYDERCRTKIIYPETPPYYRGTLGEKFKPGQEYTVSVGGYGFGREMNFIYAEPRQPR
jgi:transketolase C-terminal domain/subunit